MKSFLGNVSGLYLSSRIRGLTGSGRLLNSSPKAQLLTERQEHSKFGNHERGGRSNNQSHASTKDRQEDAASSSTGSG